MSLDDLLTKHVELGNLSPETQDLYNRLSTLKNGKMFNNENSQPVDTRQFQRYDANNSVAKKQITNAIQTVAPVTRPVSRQEWSDAITSPVEPDQEQQKQMVSSALGVIPMAGITTYHGSPASGIKNFDLNFRGTGEGRLAADSPLKESFKDMIAHGLYTAENEGIAKGYKERLGQGSFSYDGKMLPEGSTHQTVAELMWGNQGDLAATLEDLAAIAPTKAKSIESQRIAKSMDYNKISQGGSTYTAELLPHPDEYLHWNKPLSEQSEGVKAALKNDQFANEVLNYFDRKGQNPTGKEFLSEFDMGDQRWAADRLSKQGVKGVKYLDANSRNPERWILKHPQGGIMDVASEQEAKSFLARNPEYTLIPPKVDHNYVTFQPESESIITHENGQRRPGAVEEAYAKVRDPESRRILEQKYPELLSQGLGTLAK